MENISLPTKYEVTPGQKENEALISIQPCQPGYGTTLGNAFRRVLLSSLPGAAVTAFKLKGAIHEFAAIDHVKEDGIEIVLNLKQLKVKVHGDGPVRLKLKKTGEGKVTAKDIEKNSEAEVINKDLVIATLTSKDANFEMEILVDKGRGYIPTELKDKSSLESDMITIDSVYTPVKNVGFEIRNVRVGNMTNFENLILDITTDGSITPQEALSQANEILMSHLDFVVKQTQSEDKPAKKTKAKKDEEEDEEETEKE